MDSKIEIQLSDEKKNSENNSSPTLPAISYFELLKYSSFRDKVYIGIGTLAAIIASFGWPINTLLFGDLVDVFVDFDKNRNLNTTLNTTNTISVDEFLDETYFFSVCLFAMSGLHLISSYLMVSCFTIAAMNQLHRIRVKYFGSILKQEIAWFDSRNSGEFTSRVTADLKRFEDGISEKLGLAIYYISGSIINLIIAFILGWKLALVVLAFAPLFALSSGLTTKIQSTFARKEQESYSSAGTVAEEVISAIRTVYAFGGEEKEMKRYETNLLPAMKSGIKRNFITGLSTGIMWLCLYLGFALGIWFGVKLVLESKENNDNLYTIGLVLVIYWSVCGIGFNLGSAAPSFEAIQIARGTAAQVFDIIERKPLIDCNSLNGLKLDKFDGNIEFRNVCFEYPMRPEVKVLNNFNLNINSHKTIAFVGPSGCGKSTIVQLIQRFYDTKHGNILIDGKDIKDLNIEWLREQIGYVGQEPILFDTTIKENIALGLNEQFISDKDIELAAIDANCHQFISQLPDKYDTYVGDSGAQLSGGQKQRIAIARALIRKPKLLILDEATAALDLENEALVQMAIEKNSKERTTIIVAHRLSTIINCDQIFYIESGKVMECGTHSQLMAKNGFYYNLVNAQQTQPNSDQFSIRMKNKENEILSLKSETILGNNELFSFVNKEVKDTKEDEEVSKYFSQIRIFRLLALDKFYIIIGLICSTIYGLSIPIYAYILGLLVEVFAQTNDSDIIWEQSVRYALYYIAIAVGLGLTSVTQITMFGIASERLTMRLRKMAFTSILDQEIGWFDRSENSSGSLCARLSSDAANVQGASGSRISVLCQAITSLIASAVIGLNVNWKLSLLTLAFMPLLVIGTIISTMIVSSQLTSDNQAIETASKIAIEAISNIRTVVSLNKQKHFHTKYTKTLESKLEAAKKKCHIKSIALGFAQSFTFFAYAATFLYGGVLIAREELTSGPFFQIIETMIYGAVFVGQSAIYTSDYQKAKIAAKNIFKLIDRKPLKNMGNQFMMNNMNECNGNIEFRDVRFNYPNRVKAQVLKGLSFSASKGETVALVGSSGCGKTTSIQLIEKFYDCTEGKILLNGNNINSLSTQWLRSQMSLVSQEPVLFSYSIRDNIAYGQNTRDVEMDEIISAANKANIHQFIKQLPNGYDTRLGNKGTQLSGGQKQRIAIARALIRNPKILLLDESTSALDTTSEKLVQSALDEASKGRTCIVVAHRLTTIQNSDRIIVIQNGVNVEEGVHKELIKSKGFYYNLYKTQCDQ